MQRLLFFLILILILVFPLGISSAQQEPVTPTPTASPLDILSPLAGEALQGSVPIIGQVLVSDFVSAELSFAYSANLTNTWFLIAEFEQVSDSGKLVDWDTTILTDGNYTLRLMVFRENGRTLTIMIPGLRIRNYSPIETPTPAPSLTPDRGLTPTPVPTLTPTLTPVPPTATPLPTNPAQRAPQDVMNNMGRGALGVAAFFALMGVYVSARRFRRR